jgi:hypothetical protein
LEIQILIGIFAVGITILAAALWLLYARFNQQPQAYRWLAYTLSFSFSCDMLSVVIRIFGGNSNIGGTLYSIGFVIFFSAFFYQILRGKILLGVLYIVNACFLVFVLYNAIFVQKLTINSYSNIIGSGIILALCILPAIILGRVRILLYKVGQIRIVFSHSIFKASRGQPCHPLDDSQLLDHY